MLCAKPFGTILEISDLKMSVYQDAASVGSTAECLQQFVPGAVAHVAGMMTDQQRDWRGFDEWYCRMMEMAVFGDENDPILVEE